jgi:low temperature requirement protein LtrA
VVPTPARFWLWAVALAVDFGTPLATGRHLSRVPPDAEHLPERFGLFTIILIGEAMVGVMRGMESQPTWTREAAISAFLSMTAVFALWWGYFDGSGATRQRALRSDADVRRFHVWTYAHLPLYLGVLVFGAGLHHTITVAGVSHLHGEEVGLLTSALALTTIALATIAQASRSQHGAPST